MLATRESEKVTTMEAQTNKTKGISQIGEAVESYWLQRTTIWREGWSFGTVDDDEVGRSEFVVDGSKYELWRRDDGDNTKDEENTVEQQSRSSSVEGVNHERNEEWERVDHNLLGDLQRLIVLIVVLKAEQMKLEEDKDEEIKRLKTQLQEKKDTEIKVQFSKEEFPPLGNSHIARPFMEAEAHYSGSTTTAPKIRKITNQLYNVKVEFEIPSCPIFGTTAIIDTGASACCINKKVIPEEALEPLTQTVFFNGLNSRHQATHKIKQGYFLIEGNKFKIPLLYAFDMRDSNGIEMLIGANAWPHKNAGYP
nr:RNA-directed DNA polymerase [Tanacetum cinerariifolium]